MLKTLATLLFSLVLAPCCLADSLPLSFAGIWRDTTSNSKYYSIHEEGDSIVLIDLSRVERTNNTLSSSYKGKLSDLVLTRVGPNVPTEPDFNGQISLHFTSSTEGQILPICEICTVIVTPIRKIF